MEGYSHRIVRTGGINKVICDGEAVRKNIVRHVVRRTVGYCRGPLRGSGHVRIDSINGRPEGSRGSGALGVVVSHLDPGLHISVRQEI